ncbi:MAG: PIN domain-containing protein [Methanomicrobiales archaeon]|jgi:predicted nucleic acid-binding protein|nr:PIN domain-containing protein [Methanomicrobiales archaeon]
MMKLVIDTNRIMAGLLKESTSRKIILDNHFLFFAPDYIETEIFQHREYLIKKAKMTESDFDTLLHILLEPITLVPFDDFKQDYSRAMEIMESIDENDAPFLAVGLALKLDGIWTEDRHFLRQHLLKVFHTGDLVQNI